MKRLYYFLLALPMLLFLASCDDDDDLPDVTFNVTMTGGVEYNGQIYVVQGDTLTVDTLRVSPNDSRNATLGATTYFWNGAPVGTTIVVPFKWSFYTSNMEVGAYIMQIRTNVYQTDKLPAVALLSYQVNVVATSDDLPDDSNELSMSTVIPQYSSTR